MATGASVDPLNPPLRCIGTIDGPVGDCAIPPELVLVTLGVIDEDGIAQAADELDTLEPWPVAFTVCRLHKKALVVWARRLWGSFADGDLYPISALPALKRRLEMDDLPVAINPDPRWAYELVQTSVRSAG